MSMLSYVELIELVEQGVITGVDPESINGTSIDIHLGPTLIREVEPEEGNDVVDIKLRDNFTSRTLVLQGENGFYDMYPNEFLLAHSREKFFLPEDITAEFKLNSSGARSGLENALATWCDPYWHDSTLTLELKNFLRYHKIRLTNGMRIGQMIFHRVTPVPRDKSYAARGRYNGDESVSAVKK